MYKIIQILIFFVLISSCKNDKTSIPQSIPPVDTPTLKSTTILFVDSLITQDSFLHYKSGKTLSSLSGFLEKDELKTGEGTFEIYNFKDSKGDKIGYLVEHPIFSGKVGQITITSPQYKTDKGIGIGSNIGELIDKYKDIKIFGSEIEGTTTANIGNLSFKLNTQFWGYDMDVSKIDRKINIAEITIKHHVPD